MAVIFPNPDNIPESVITGYQAQNNLIYTGNTGFLNINLSTLGLISAGTVFEINGHMVKVETDEPILYLEDLPKNDIFYVYAAQASGLVHNTNLFFYASDETPIWRTGKGGYYDVSNSRALLRGMTDNNGNILWIMKMSDILYAHAPPDEGGQLVYEKLNVRIHETVWLDIGWYRYEMVSGTGNGNGIAGTTANTGGGGIPIDYIELRGVFFHFGGNIITHVGGNGFKGGHGGVNTVSSYTSRGGGGGSGAGEETYIIIGSVKYDTGRIKPGNGGHGHGTGVTGQGIFEYEYNENRTIILGDGQDANVVSNNARAENGGGMVLAGNNQNEIIYNAQTCGNGFGGGGQYGINILALSKGGGGGAPGWYRPYNSNGAGYIKIYKLS